MKYLKVVVKHIEQKEQDVVIALLSQLPFHGFEQQDDHILAYAQDNEVPPKELEDILKEREWTQELIEEVNWNDRWEKSFEPITLENLRIRAHFHEKVNDGKAEIVITPRMSFGTGHHATTQLMLEQMSTMEFKNRKVLDYGTGTGVLAIYAEQLGASSVLGIDNDPWSVENAEENINRNQCNKVSIKSGDSNTINGRWDIILANINLNVILESIETLSKTQKKGDEVLFSGIMGKDLQLLKDALKPYYTANLDKAKGDWRMIHCIKM